MKLTITTPFNTATPDSAEAERYATLHMQLLEARSQQCQGPRIGPARRALFLQLARLVQPAFDNIHGTWFLPAGKHGFE